jgi:hypothetical protein
MAEQYFSLNYIYNDAERLASDSSLRALVFIYVCDLLTSFRWPGTSPPVTSFAEFSWLQAHCT